MRTVLVTCLLLVSAGASVLDLDIYYPESGLDEAVIDVLEGNIFSLGLSSLPYSDEIVDQYDAQGLFYFPWFGNYTLFVNNHTHRQGQGHWRVSVPLPADFSGDLSVLLASNFYGPTVLACEAFFAMGTCQSRESPWQVHVPAASASASLAVYPSFSTSGQGSSYTILSDFYSAGLDNFRDIAVHVPWAVLENPAPRPVNVVVLLDGDLASTALFAAQGGMDAAQLTGALPEVVLVGVPAASNGSACGDPASDGCSQRYYELTPSPCNAQVAQCQPGQAAGGADLLLQFVWDEVLPAVLDQLGQPRGEVSITGYSLGGLTSCYAASTRPTQFQRAYCVSPSVWWNNGELVDTIAANFEASGAKPTAVVVSVGMQEGPSIMLVNTDPQPWTVYIEDVVAAWQRIGLGSAAATSPSGLVESSLVYYTAAGGVHNILSWVETLSYGLSLMYAPSFPADYVQSISRNQWQFPQACAGDDDDSGDADLALVVVLSALGLCLLLPANVYLLWKGVQARAEEQAMASKEETDGGDF